MALKQAKHFISEEAYLQGELMADTRHEYIQGEVFAMAGASRNHALLAADCIQALTNHLQHSACMTFSPYIKVKADGNFLYPNVMVVCDAPEGNDLYTEKPTRIVEVLSNTTRRQDKTTKQTAYKKLPSLQEYVLIEQDHVEIELFRRSKNWFAEHYFLGDNLDLESIALNVSVADLYRRVDNEDMRDYLQQLQEQAR